MLILSESALPTFDVVIISVSTTGQGDMPLNAQRFWKTILRKKLPSNYFRSVNCAIFGLGDSSYPKQVHCLHTTALTNNPRYNWAALKLQKRMNQLGSEQILQLGQSDEQHPEGLVSLHKPNRTRTERCKATMHPSFSGDRNYDKLS